MIVHDFVHHIAWLKKMPSSLKYCKGMEMNQNDTVNDIG